MSRTVNEKARAVAQAFADEGVPRAKIAERLGVSPRTVSRWLGPLKAGRPATGTSRWAEWRRGKEQENPSSEP